MADAKDLPRGVRIRQHRHGKRSIQIAFSYQGRACRETLRNVRPNETGIAEAARRLEQIKRSIKNGEFEYAKEFPNSRGARKLDPASAMTVALLIDEYARHMEETLQPSTLIAYRSMFETRIKPALGKIRVRDLTAEQILGWLASPQFRNLSMKFVSNLLSPLRQAFYYAAFKHYRTGNPVPAKLSLNSLKLRRTGGNQADPLTPEEIESVLKACREPCVRNLFQFALASGLRQGELAALSWQNIDLGRGTALIRNSVVLAHEKGTKTPKGTRVVDLLPDAAAALRSQNEITGRKARVFYHPRTGLAFSKASQINELWKEAIEVAGIRYRSAKQTRHTYASMQITRGVNLYYLADQLGHEGIDMINHNYGKFIRASASVRAQLDRNGGTLSRTGIDTESPQHADSEA